MIGARAHRAFTLIEVMIATVILGLGILGLAALFAGVARQQLVASRQSESVGRTQNALAMTVDRFGRYETASSQAQALPLFAWLPLTSRNGAQPGPGALPNSTLTSDPYIPAVGSSGQPRYFEINAPSYLMYWDASNANMLPQVVTLSNFNVGGAPTGLEPLILPHRNIVYDSVRLTIQTADNMAPYGNVQNIVLDYTDDATQTPQDIEQSGVIQFNGTFGGVTLSGVVFDLATNRNSINPAGLRSGSIDACMGRMLRRVEIEPYLYREDTVLSLNDRLAFEPDDNFPGGRRPYMGMTCLIRATGTGASQITMMSYAIEPTATGVEFYPPEQLADYEAGVGLLRDIQFRLGFDEDAQQYYIEPRNNEMRWAIQPGQIILFRGDSGVSVTDPDDADMVMLTDRGSDIPVRIVRTETRGMTGSLTYRGYLNDSPRTAGRSLLPNRNTTEALRAWVLHPTPTSTLDQSVWRVTPIEARQFQVR